MTTLMMNTANTIGLTGLAGWFKRLEAKLTHQSKVRQTIKELSRLSNAELRDIGITRGDIYAIANESHYDNYDKIEHNANLRGWS